ncbi:hypothetical protein D5086_020624 [Populus alba]|uniref:Uncharacterized protein n=1 Tax=Populus alba TaxID=43335 RepID=A0ACC4BKQ4_POPAL
MAESSSFKDSRWSLHGMTALVTGVCDASCRVQREKLIEEVNNVGKVIRKSTTVYSAEEYSKVMATNFDSAYHLSQIAHPLLKASGAGSIVFISSVADLMHLGTGSIYGASKGE